MTSSIQQFITTPIRMTFVLEEHHLRQLDHILRTGHATVEYVTGSQSLVITSYESVEDLIRGGNPLDDPLIRLEVRRITADTHVTLLLSKAAEGVKLTIMNDDSRRPDFRHQISSELAAWLEQIKAPRNRLSAALRPGVLIPIMCLVSIGCVMLGLALPSGGGLVIGPLSIFVGIVVVPVLLVLGLWAAGHLFSSAQFHFGSGRKAKRDEK